MGDTASKYAANLKPDRGMTSLEVKEKENETIDGEDVTEESSKNKMTANLDDRGLEPDKTFSSVMGFCEDDRNEMQRNEGKTKAEAATNSAKGNQYACSDCKEKHGEVTMVQGDKEDIQRSNSFKIVMEEEEEREKDKKDDDEDEDEELVQEDLLSFAWQIARGMVSLYVVTYLIF